jgi:hypothetical protein
MRKRHKYVRRHQKGIKKTSERRQKGVTSHIKLSWRDTQKGVRVESCLYGKMSKKVSCNFYYKNHQNAHHASPAPLFVVWVLHGLSDPALILYKIRENYEDIQTTITSKFGIMIWRTLCIVNCRLVNSEQRLANRDRLRLRNRCL